MLLTLITIVHIAVCTMLILIVLLQQGKGADMGATFGGGSNTLFGASGADNLLTRVTTVTAFIFMCTSVFLAQSAKPGMANSGSIFQTIPENTPPATTIPLDATTGAPIGTPPTGAEATTAPATGQAAGTVAEGAAAPVTQPQPAPIAADANVPPAPPAAEAPANEPPPAAPVEAPAPPPVAGTNSNAPAGANP